MSGSCCLEQQGSAWVMNKSARFKVDPRLASLLGEGYRSSEEALKELVDNAWDADAEVVRVQLPHHVTPGSIVKDRPEPHGQREERHQAPCRDGPEGQSAGSAAFRSERPRQEVRSAAPRCHPLRAQRAPRPATKAPGEGAWRQGLRLQGHPARAPAATHHPAHCPPGHRVERATGAVPLGGGAHTGMAPQPQAAASARGASGRHPPRPPPVGLQPHPAEEACPALLKGVRHGRLRTPGSCCRGRSGAC